MSAILDDAGKAQLYKTEPMRHQLEALKRMHGRTGFMLSMEQGTGKTWCAINEAAQLWGEGKVNGVLVFADNGVHVNWTEIELPKHMPDWVRWKAVAWNSAALVDEARRIEDIMGGADGDSSVLRIFTMNWEALAHARSVEMAVRFCNSVTRLMMIGDESQAIMNPSTARVKALEKLKAASVVRRTMTGTPVGGVPFHLFSQYRFLDPTILRTTSYVAFKAEYADMVPPPVPGVPRETDRIAYAIAKRLPQGARFPQIVRKDEITDLPMYKNLDKLSKLIEQHTFRVLKKDCLDLPEKIYTQTFFELAPGAQREAYRKMEKEYRFIVASEEHPVTKLTALGKLTQITSGFLMRPHETLPKTTVTDQMFDQTADNPKLKLLGERLTHSIAELGNQVIVWCHYREELKQVEALCNEMRFSCFTYYGDTKKEDRTEAIRGFQACERSVFIVQIDTGSTGITLHAAQHVIYYGNTFSYIDRSQSEDRAHRIGQKNNVLYEDLVARGTRDMFVVETLRNKKNLADVINQDAR